VPGAPIGSFAINGHGRRHNDPAHISLIIGNHIEQNAGAAGVDIDIPGNFVHRLPHANFRRKMDNTIHALQGLHQGIAIPHIAMYELRIRRDVSWTDSTMNLLDQ
jgi:hypothetical protein